jgi:hypothetical protein
MMISSPFKADSSQEEIWVVAWVMSTFCIVYSGKEQYLVQLWSLHCDYGQGYFFSPGLDSVAAQKLLEESLRW